MNFDILGNWRGGAVKDAGDEAIRKYGRDALDNIDIGVLEGMYGADRTKVENYIKSKQQSALNNSPLRSRAINAGLVGADGKGGADYGATEGSYLANIVKQEKDVKKQTKREDRTIKIEDEGRALGNATALRNLDLQAGRDQYLHQSKTQEARYAFERGEGKMDRRHQAELADNSNDLQMQMSLMQNDIAEKRMDYDRETRRMDKRTAAIAQLMSGLGSLGGAFSL